MRPAEHQRERERGFAVVFSFHMRDREEGGWGGMGLSCA